MIDSSIESGGLALREHTLTEHDIAGPYLDSIPKDPAERTKIEHLSYTSIEEKLAEKFQSSVTTLRRLNPDASFVSGEIIMVPNIWKITFNPLGELLLVLQRGREVLSLYADGQLVVRYPVTINPEKTPTRVMITRLRAADPEYLYTDSETGLRYKFNPGPNNVVGTEWISLDEKGFGIHGSPNPKNISKSSSLGCIRLVNWDIEELGPWISEGVMLLPID